MQRSRSFILLLSLTAIWCALIVLPPAEHLMLHSDRLAQPVYRLGAALCHQWDSRSLHLFGIKFAVCARCTGIYVGFALAVLTMAFRRWSTRGRERLLWLAALAPMLLDVGLSAAGCWTATLASRLLTGAVFGAVAGVLLAPLLVEGFRETYQRILTRYSDRHELHAR